jgi:subtilisin family serine protease
MFTQYANVNDDHGHGTHVAGIVAARQNNGIGGSGLAPTAKILPVKVLDSTMSGTTDTLALGIRYAVDRGAKILNVSVNTDAATDTVKAAVRYAGERGAIIVASSGNNGRNIDLLGSYIAAFPDAAIVSVAAMTEQGRLWNRANTGLLSVDLAAPGERIVSTTSGSSYQSRTGTSAAAPFVAGAMALLSAARPDLPMSALRATIIATTRRNDILASLIGGAQLDVGAAMHKVLGGAWRTAPPVDDAAAPQLTLGTKSGVRAGSRVPLRWAASGSDRVASWRVSLDRRVVATLPVSRARMTRVVKRAGRHRWRVVGFDDQRVKLVSAQRTFRVLRRR